MNALVDLCAATLWPAGCARIADRVSAELAPDAARDGTALLFLSAAAATAALAFGGGPAAAVTCGGLTAAGVLDARSGFLVDELTLTTAALAGALALAAGHAFGALAGIAALAAPAALANALTREAWLGWGDVKGFAALGAGLGIERVAAALFAASIFGLAAAALTRKREIRFGPYLAAGALAALGACA